MDTKTREELNALSKRAFGTSSKWQKLVNDGFYEEFTRDREVMIPKANGELMKKVFTDKKKVARRYSVEEVRKLMEDILEKSNGSNVGAIETGTKDTTKQFTIELPESFESGMVVKGEGIPEGAVVE